MRTWSRRLVAALILAAWAQAASAQTANDIVERALTAMGGRAALGKIKSRSATGTITLSTPAGELPGSIETLNAVPNKSRTLIKVDLSPLGAGMLVLDQRFNGIAGYALDSLQGNRDITGNQLDNMTNASFPTPLLNYKELGATIALAGKEKVGDRDAYVLVFEPVTGSVIRDFIDAETYMVVKAVVKVDVPQLGREVEQTVEFSDFRTIDGVKIAFKVRATSAVQNYSVDVAKVEHNVPIDEKLFSKPPQ